MPLGEEQDERGEDRADDQRPRLRARAQPVLQHQEGRRRPTKGPKKVPAPPRSVIMTTWPEVVQYSDSIGTTVRRRASSDAREPGEAGGEDERQVLDAVDVVAAGHGAVAVLADGLQHRAERRVEDALERRHREADQHVGEVVEGERRLDGSSASGPRPSVSCGMPRRPSSPPVTVGQVEADEVEELGEGQGQHREVDAAPAQAEEADDRAAQRRPGAAPRRARARASPRGAWRARCRSHRRRARSRRRGRRRAGPV